jgi:cation diffusion facilitator family transporter
VIDVAVSAVNLYSIHLAASPADEGHPFGHGKAESLAGLAQTAVIGGIGVWIVVEAAQRLRRGVRPEHAEWGILAMAVSAAVSWLIARHLRRVGEATDSVVLRADALHYATDVWTNGGILLALVLLHLTGLALFDPLIALAVGAIILMSAYRLLARSVHDLMDAALPAIEQQTIERVIGRHRSVLSFHDLRTRRAGSERQVDFTIVACRHLPLGQAHDLVDHVQQEIEAAVPPSHVVVHAEPCRPGCPQGEGCALRGGRPDLLAHE